MDLKSLLQEALKDEFKSRAVVTTVKELIESKVENEVTQKYKDITLFKDGMEFELLGVYVSSFTYFPGFDRSNVDIVLFYTCKSKLPKDKAERLEQIKEEYKPGSYLHDWSRYKSPITHRLRYRIPMSKALSGYIDLNLETINH